MSARKDPSALVFGGEPRADLLPPEVHVRAKARSTRRMLAFLVVLALLISSAGTVAAYFYAAEADERLEAAQARTTELLAEQLQYSEARNTANLVELAKTTRGLALTYEIDWPGLINEIEAYLPEDTSIDSAVMNSRLPWAGGLGTQGPLRSPRIATLTIVIRSSALIDAPEVIRRLAQLPGFADASPDVVSYTDEVFRTTITLNLNRDALLARFADETESTE